MNWHKNNVFDEVDEAGQKCVSTRWVFSLKETPNAIVPKARLVCRGFEELNIHELQRDSPTCASDSPRLLLAVICQNKWQVHSLDIKSAFFKGEAEKQNILWKLNNCVHGLAAESLYWNNKVKEIMLNTGGKMSRVDPAGLNWLDERCKVTGVCASPVDDFLSFCAGSQILTTMIPIRKSKVLDVRSMHFSAMLLLLV